MIPQNTSRRPEQAIELGPRHGYRIENDQAFINAELQVPPQHPGGEWTLQLWASDHPYQEGALTGLKVAEIAVGLPTPLGPYLHQVEAQAPAQLPLQGRAYAMVLALVKRERDGQTTVDAFANYAELQTFIAPHFEGQVGYQLHGDEAVLVADGIANPRLDGNVSGTLSLSLWAFPEAGASADGLCLAAAELGSVSGQFWLPDVESRVAFSAPPVGRYRLAMLLSEWTADGYVARDRREFDALYERRAPAPVAPAEALRLVPKSVETSAPAPASGLVSIQTASADELAKVKGLTLKLAQEIVKARPFASLADLIRVRGIGEKTIERLKSFLTL